MEFLVDFSSFSAVELQEVAETAVAGGEEEERRPRRDSEEEGEFDLLLELQRRKH